MIRPDISNSLIHLTRDRNGFTAENVFDKILENGFIKGSSENIRGKDTCICLSETPISAIGQIIAQQNDKFHYGSFGFLFPKKYLFDKGARPVIYQPDEDFKLLTDTLQYRHVRYEINKIDWTWEREWRFKTDKLVLDPRNVTLIVPDREKIEKIKNHALKGLDLLSIASRGRFSGRALPWHFISLQDLGY